MKLACARYSHVEFWLSFLVFVFFWGWQRGGDTLVDNPWVGSHWRAACACILRLFVDACMRRSPHSAGKKKRRRTDGRAGNLHTPVPVCYC